MHADYREYGYIRCAAYAPPLVLADPMSNAERIADRVRLAARRHSSLVLFPELAVSGYSCEDLFFSHALLGDVRQALLRIAKATADTDAVVVVGAPFDVPDGRLFNCAFVFAGGRVQGAVPKIHLPNYSEFYDRRWFASGAAVELDLEDAVLGRFTLTPRQLFAIGPVQFAIEICEDLWAPHPPGIEHALAGAQLIVNPSASNELVSKADYRRELVRMNSAQRICAYLYASSGPTESTKDIVFGGHLLAAESGAIVAESERFALGGSSLLVDLDWQKLHHDRLQHATFASSPRPGSYRVVRMPPGPALPELARTYPRHPFVPDDLQEFDARAREILSIQATGLARRMQAVGDSGLLLGLSGGLDSTLAFLVCLDALDLLAKPHGELHAVTMPGPGTSQHTRESAFALAAAAGVHLHEVDIRAAVAQHLSDLGHDPTQHDVVFENAQARERTQLLFNFANKYRSIVVGTGDMSELALGWCTYNGDHMANYNVNASVPKTMVAYLVRWYATHRADPELASVLQRVLDTPISPELIPQSDDELVAQHTESIVGPYELHDFFLFHFVRNRFRPRKIFVLACRTFAPDYAPPEVKKWLEIFCERFFRQQFKRTTLPPGPKVGSVSLSPRGDWRMPDEASPGSLLAEIAALEESWQTLDGNSET
jgi:NAD+ synthase (glutamine-hydrolysing)